MQVRSTIKEMNIEYVCTLIATCMTQGRLFGNNLLNLCWPTNLTTIDNHDGEYPGMAVQLYVQSHMEHYHLVTQNKYSLKLMAELKTTPLLTYIHII